jgi:hypothetical protein
MTSKVLLPLSNIMAAFVHSNSSLLSDVSSGLPTYNNHNITKLNVCSVQAHPAEPLTLPPKSATAITPKYILSLNASPQCADSVMQLSDKLRILNCGRMKFELQI